MHALIGNAEIVLHERIEIQEESIERNQLALQDARSLFAQGKGLRVDTLRAFTLVKNLYTSAIN